MTKEQIKTAVVLVNLGTPDEPTPKAVRRYLKEFLWDPRVIEGGALRRAFWWLVLNLIILNLRPRRVARLYSKIWEQDSPMRRILNQQVAALQVKLQQRFPQRAPTVFAAMTYGEPGFSRVLTDLRKSGYGRVLVIPMYPQYSATSTAPVYDRVAQFQLAQREMLDVRIVKDYHDHPLYIEALAASVERHWEASERGQKLVLSYHGIPQAYADQGDPYPEQCRATSRLLGQRLGLKPDTYQTCFQSRFGPAEWVKPYTDATLKAYPKQGVTRVDLISPAFSADCLETLEEIALENKAVFEKAGGDSYAYIPALNADERHIDLLTTLVEEQASDWLQYA